MFNKRFYIHRIHENCIQMTFKRALVIEKKKVNSYSSMWANYCLRGTLFSVIVYCMFLDAQKN